MDNEVQVKRGTHPGRVRGGGREKVVVRPSAILSHTFYVEAAPEIPYRFYKFTAPYKGYMGGLRVFLHNILEEGQEVKCHVTFSGHPEQFVFDLEAGTNDLKFNPVIMDEWEIANVYLLSNHELTMDISFGAVFSIYARE